MPFFVKLPFAPGASDGPVERYVNFIDDKATFGQRQLRRHGYGGYEVDATAALCTIFSRHPAGFSFFDVGSNVGHYSFLCQGLWPESSVVAFEPSQRTHAWVKRIAEGNGMPLRAEHLAVGETAGEVTLYLSQKSDASNSLNRAFRDHVGEEIVRAVSLDGYCAANDVWPDVLKIDTETVEEQVLRGARQLLEERHPWVLVEVLAKSAAGVGDRISDLLENIGGYHLYSVGDGEAPWRPRERIVASSEAPDWLLSPVPLDEGFFADLDEWRRRIRGCTAATNIHDPARRKLSPAAKRAFAAATQARTSGDRDAARAAYAEAADLGARRAHYWLGRAAEDAGDYAESLFQYHLGAARGEPAATRGVARAFQLGRGVPVDLEEARGWLVRAVRLDDETAIEELAALDALRESRGKAKECVK
ncbi:MAG: FkbM family methyltransferase [Myxococcota bacterium]